MLRLYQKVRIQAKMLMHIYQYFAAAHKALPAFQNIRFYKILIDHLPVQKIKEILKTKQRFNQNLKVCRIYYDNINDHTRCQNSGRNIFVNNQNLLQMQDNIISATLNYHYNINISHLMSTPQESVNAMPQLEPNHKNPQNQNFSPPPTSQRQIMKNPNMINFEGSPTEFNNFMSTLNDALLNSHDELAIKIKGVNHQLESMQSQPAGPFAFLLGCCCCSQDCLKACACCICLLSCCLLMLFWWIILPITYCCVKSKVQKITKVVIDNQFYEKLSQFSIGNNHKFRKFILFIQDNNINLHKLQCIRTFIQQAGVSQFIFMNEALPINGDDSQWSNFNENIKTITNIQGLNYAYKWQDKIGKN